MSDIKGAGEALRKAGVSKADAEKMTPQELVQAVEAQGTPTNYSDAATAVNGLER